MHVFVTGASGHIGSALVPELLEHGHTVAGLARSDASAEALASWGADVVRGDLDDLAGLQAAATAADGVIHLAFKHDFGNFDASVAADLAAVNAIGEALVGSDKPFVITSGTLLLARVAPGTVGTEDVVGAGGHRIDAENAAIAFAERGVRSSVVRLPPLVHSDLDKHGFGPTLIRLARQAGHAGYPGDGANRWPAVHTRDAATLYRLALESAPAGTRLHAVQDEGVPFREIAGAIGRGLDLPVESIEDLSYFEFLAMFIALDNPSSSAKTRELLGWEPTRAGLLDDYAAGHYFA